MIQIIDVLLEFLGNDTSMFHFRLLTAYARRSLETVEDWPVRYIPVKILNILIPEKKTQYSSFFYEISLTIPDMQWFFGLKMSTYLYFFYVRAFSVYHCHLLLIVSVL